MAALENKTKPTAKPTACTDGTGSYVEEIRSNASVEGNLNSKFLYNQESEGPYQEMSKGASVLNNRYLTKIAMSRMIEKATPAVKLSLGMSAAGLGLSGLNYTNGLMTRKATEKKEDLERKSLNALNNINKTLTTSTLNPSTMAVQRPKGF